MGENKTEARPREGGPESPPRGADARFFGVGSDGMKPPQGGAKNRRCITDDPRHNIDIEP